MKKLYYIILLVLISVITFNCQKEARFAGGNFPGTGNTSTNPITATLQGNVLNGSSLGQFKDQLNVIHNISGSFRVRRL